MSTLRIATFNLENFDDGDGPPSLQTRIAVMRPQLERLRADVLCLQEVHSQGTPDARTLSALDELVSGTRYADYQRVHTQTEDGRLYHERNLVILSRFAVLEQAQIRNDVTPAPEYRQVTRKPLLDEAHPVRWERPIQAAKLDLGQQRSLHVLNVHLKSRLPTFIEGQKRGYEWESAAGWAEGFFISSMKRVGQAVEARHVIDRIFDEDPRALIAVCGDFNADHHEVPLQAIRGDVEELGNPDLVERVMVPCEFTIPQSSRYSYLHRGRPSMLDHVIASRSLLGFYRGAEVHNEILHDESVAFGTDKKFPESDHAPVVAEFDLG